MKGGESVTVDGLTHRGLRRCTENLSNLIRQDNKAFLKKKIILTEILSSPQHDIDRDTLFAST